MFKEDEVFKVTCFINSFIFQAKKRRREADEPGTGTSQETDSSPDSRTASIKERQHALIPDEGSSGEEDESQRSSEERADKDSEDADAPSECEEDQHEKPEEEEGEGDDDPGSEQDAASHKSKSNDDADIENDEKDPLAGSPKY